MQQAAPAGGAAAAATTTEPAWKKSDIAVNFVSNGLTVMFFYTLVRDQMDAIEKTKNTQIAALESTTNTKVDAIGKQIAAIEKTTDALEKNVKELGKWWWQRGWS